MYPHHETEGTLSDEHVKVFLRREHNTQAVARARHDAALTLEAAVLRSPGPGLGRPVRLTHNSLLETYRTVTPLIDRLLGRSTMMPVHVMPVRDMGDAAGQYWVSRGFFRIEKPRGVIRIKTPAMTNILPYLLAHEYTHHHQHEKGAELSDSFSEGHATMTAIRAILDWSPDEDARCLAAALRKIHLDFAIQYLENDLLSRVMSQSLNESHKQQGRAGLLDYHLGSALFAIAEAKHGPGIYAEALRNPRAVLE